MEVSGVEALHPHPPAERLGVGGEPGEGDAEVVVQREHLLLVAGERGRPPLEGREDGVRLVLEADRGRALLHRLHSVLDLVEAALRRPGGHVRVVLVPELRGDFRFVIELISNICSADLTILNGSGVDFEDDQLPLVAMTFPFTATKTMKIKAFSPSFVTLIFAFSASHSPVCSLT